MNESYADFEFDGMLYHVDRQLVDWRPTLTIRRGDAVVGNIVLDWRNNQITENLIDQSLDKIFPLLCAFIQDSIIFPFKETSY